MLSIRVSFSLSVTKEKKENIGNHTVFYKKVQKNLSIGQNIQEAGVL